MSNRKFRVRFWNNDIEEDYFEQAEKELCAEGEDWFMRQGVDKQARLLDDRANEIAERIQKWVCEGDIVVEFDLDDKSVPPVLVPFIKD